MLAAALLAGQGQSQQQIAEALELSQAVVSRLLLRAQQESVLRREVRFIQENADAKKLRLAFSRAHSHQLSATLEEFSRHFAKRRGPYLRVFSGGGSKLTELQRRIEFRRQAAPYVKELILRARTCGLTWGGMLWNLLEALRSTPNPSPWTDHKIDFMPLCGEPLSRDPSGFSSSSLASELGRLANGESYTARSIAMVPAFIPERFTPAKRHVIEELIDFVKSHREIFGDNNSEQRTPGLADNLDMILTSVGTSNHPFGFGRDSLLEPATLEVLRQIGIGDLGGVCLGRTGLTTTQERVIKAVGERWTGLRDHHLTACAERALKEADQSTGKPGVVVVSVGKDRAPAIFEAVKKGLLNHLVIDDELQVALDKMVKDTLRTERPA